MRTLHLTTPLTRSPDVVEAQVRLAGHNTLRADYAPGPPDGVYGPATMRAAKRAKFWCGYPDKQIDGAYGAKLDGFLRGHTLPPGYQARRTIRLNEKVRVPLRELALKEARSHLGVRESPAGSNRVLFSDWYGSVGPWCAMFVSYCYVKAGSEAFRRGSRWAYVPFIVQDARAGRNGLTLTSKPQPGDLVCFDWDHDGVADHVGLFERWADTTHLGSVEGNTSADEQGSQSNGGMVAQRLRTRAEVEAFVRVTR